MARLYNMVEMARMSFVLLLFAASLAAQAPGRKAGSFPVDSITVEGNRILGASAIIEVSGLKRGEKGDSAAFDAARDRLLASGYFDTIAYRYKSSASGGYDLTFEVREVGTLYPIRILALSGSTQEIAAYLKSKDPLFSGKMPGTQQVIQRTAREIEQYLESKGHPDKVTGKVIATEPGRFEIDFTPARGLPAVSAVVFEGSKVIGATTLHNKISEVAFGQPFTEEGFRLLLESQIRPLYEAKGYMSVTFPKIETTPAAEVAGVDVKVTVDEGSEYKLVRVAVAGRSASESARILKTAKLPQMTIADFDQVKQAAARVKEAMRHQGYIEAEVTTDRKLDEAKKTVEFFLVVETGPEYTFGKLTVEGLGLDGEAAIRKMWSVKPGDPFPVDYPEYFAGKVKEEGLFDNLGDTKASRSINSDTHVVDVTLDFKGAPKQKEVRRP
jgi:outer membrane protein insertion porin family